MNNRLYTARTILYTIMSACVLIILLSIQKQPPSLPSICKPAVVTAVRGYNLLPPEVHIAGACGDRLILSGSTAMTLAAQYEQGDTIR